MPTGIQLRAVLPGSALKQGAVDDRLGGGVQVLHDWYLVAEGVGDQGRVGADDTRDGGLRDAVELGEQLLARVVSQPGSGSGARTGTAPAPSSRRPEDGRKRKWPRTGLQPHSEGVSCYYS